MAFPRLLLRFAAVTALVGGLFACGVTTYRSLQCRHEAHQKIPGPPAPYLSGGVGGVAIERPKMAVRDQLYQTCMARDAWLTG